MGKKNELDQNKLQYIEKLGIFFESYGVSRTLGRVLGYLLIANPPQQSMKDLTTYLGVSKSSISTSTNSLINMGIIEKIRLPGERSDKYHIAPKFISKIIDEKLKGTVKWGEFFIGAIELLEDENPTKEVLTKALAWTNFLDAELPKLRDRFEKEFNQKLIAKIN